MYFKCCWRYENFVIVIILRVKLCRFSEKNWQGKVCNEFTLAPSKVRSYNSQNFHIQTFSADFIFYPTLSLKSYCVGGTERKFKFVRDLQDSKSVL